MAIPVTGFNLFGQLVRLGRDQILCLVRRIGIGNSS
jgi:hypothetical protein